MTAYQALARRWRPQNYAAVVGQEHVVKVLENAISQQRTHHAYLFSGTRGVGKTTIARLFAKSLNCEQPQGVEPCGVCSCCQELQQGRFVDLIEIDAASRTKVEDTRELLDNVQYRPTRGRFKVYLIDEVHMLSRHSFNALLKTLEEPPPHVKFLLATTEPQKLPITVLSRCLQFNLRSLSVEEITQQLHCVLQGEGVAVETEALQALAVAAKGSMRDALSLADQAVAHGQGQVATAQVLQMLGQVQPSAVIALLDRLIEGDAAALMSEVDHLCAYAPNFDNLLAELASALHKMAMQQFLGAGAARVSPDWLPLLPLAKRVSPEQIQIWYRVMLEGRRELSYAPDSRTELEISLMRALALHQGVVSVGAASPEQMSRTSPPAESAATVAASTVPAESASAVPVPVTTTVPVNPSTEAFNEAPPLSSYVDLSESDESEQQHFYDEQDEILSQAEALRGSSSTDEVAPSATPADAGTATPTVNPELQSYMQLKNRLRSQKRASEPPAKKSEPSLAPPRPAAEAKGEVIEAKAISPAAVPEQKAEAPLPGALPLDQQWEHWVDNAQAGGLAQQVMLNAVLEQQGDQITLLVERSCEHLLSDHVTGQITEALSALMQRPIALNCVIEERAERLTPAKLKQQRQQQRLEQARTALFADAGVQYLQQQYDAQLDPDSIQLR